MALRSNLLSRAGRAVTPVSSAALGGAVATSAAVGFARGVTSQDISGGIYEMATGDPEIDQYVFGTDMGITGLMAPGLSGVPLVGGASARGARTRQKLKTATNSRLYQRYGAANKPSSGYFNQRFGNSAMPQVDGSVVFGAYHSRMG